RQIANVYLDDYRLKNPRSAVFAEYAIKHLSTKLGETMLIDVNEQTVIAYQMARLKEKASPKTVNEEVGFLLRMLGEQGDALRIRMKRNKSLKLKARSLVGKAYSEDQKRALLKAATVRAETVSIIPANEAAKTGRRGKPGTRSPFILPVLELAFNA